VHYVFNFTATSGGEVDDRIVRNSFVTVMASALLVFAVPAPELTSKAVDRIAASLSSSSPDSRAVRWSDCDDESDAGVVLQCGTLTVPLDYANPNRGTITLALIKRRADDGARRRGTLMVNPGGPGGSGVWMVKNLAPRAALHFGETVAEEFDIVGFDPRGVARSGAIRCVDDRFMDSMLLGEATPPTASLEVQRACTERYGETLSLYSTATTARDLDRIRAAVGDQQLTFYGASYGTYLGAVYASMFPNRIRAMVLDAAYLPNFSSTEEWLLGEVAPFELALQRWANWCQRDSTCQRNAGPNPIATWDDVAAAIRTKPLPSGADVPTNERILQLATQTSLYRVVDYPDLSDAIGRARVGDGSALYTLAADSLGRSNDGTWPASSQSPIVIACASGLRNWKEPRDLEAAANRIRRAAPHFSSLATVGDLVAPCTHMLPRAKLISLKTVSSGAIVVIGGRNDPATPLAQAETMQRALGKRVSLVINEGEGHIARRTSSCITAVIESTIAAQRVPVDRYSCAPDPAS
jgi:pimeloyl-ACP methyl ester carboxylesterase